MAIERQKELRRRQQRKKKVRALRARLMATKDPAERARLIQKIRKISPNAPVPTS